MVRLRLPPTIRVIAISCTLLYLSVSYGQTHFYKDPGSAFFDPSRAFERSYSLVREYEASDWKNEIHHILKGRSNPQPDGQQQVKIQKKGNDPRVCAVVLSAHWEGAPFYAETTISSALAGLTPAERADVDLRLYIANTNRSIHPAHQSWLESVVDETFTAEAANVYPSKIQYLLTLEREKNHHVKSAIDYAIGLQRCVLDSRAPYIAVFEGDTVLADGWVSRAMMGLKDIKEKFDMNNRMWLYMRLFNQEKSTGWASKGMFENNVLLISLGVDVAVVIIAFILRKISRRFMGLITPLSTFFICIFTVPAFVILFFQSGKASLLPPSPGLHREDGFGCCSQGLIFPREVGADLASWLEEKSTQLSYELALMEYSRQRRLALFALYPLSVQHIGFQSLINPRRSDDDIQVWSMAFENQSPRQLARDHERNVKAFYGREAWVKP